MASARPRFDSRVAAAIGRAASSASSASSGSSSSSATSSSQALVAGGRAGAGLERRLEQARSSGALKLRLMGLEEIPEAVLCITGVVRPGGGVGPAGPSRETVARPAQNEDDDDCGVTGKIGSRHSAVRAGPRSTAPVSVAFDAPQSTKWWDCAHMTSIDLGENKLRAIPASLGAAFGRDLRVLELDSNLLSEAALPAALWEALPVLQRLSLRHNQLGALPPGVAALPELRELFLDGNKLVALPVALAARSLATLTVSHNQLARLFDADPIAAGPAPFALAVALTTLDLSHNQLTTAGLPSAAWFARLERLLTLDVQHNRLASPLPSLAGTQRLHTLDLAHNQLQTLPELPPFAPTGQAPTSSASSSSSSSASSSSSFSSSSSSSSGATASLGSGLQVLTASYNRLTSIDPVLVCGGLVTLVLHDNKLSSVPADLSTSVRHLKHLHLANNDLSDLPPVLAFLPLHKLVLDGNPLRAIPAAKRAAPTPDLLAYLRSRVPDAARAAAERREDKANRGVTASPASSSASFSTSSSSSSLLGSRHGAPSPAGVVATEATEATEEPDDTGEANGKVLWALREGATTGAVTLLAGLGLGRVPRTFENVQVLENMGLARKMHTLDLSGNRIGLGTPDPALTSSASSSSCSSSSTMPRSGLALRRPLPLGSSSAASSSASASASPASATPSLAAPIQLAALQSLTSLPFFSSSLHTLILDRNELTVIPSALRSARALRSLSLRHNRISSETLRAHSAGLFTALPLLTNLDLRNNRLEDDFPIETLLLSPENAPHNATADGVPVAGADFGTVAHPGGGGGGSSSALAPRPHPSLARLLLGTNRMQRLSPYLLDLLPRLEELDLSGNMLGTLDFVPELPANFGPDSPPPLWSHRCLRSLDLSNNNLATVPAEFGSLLLFPALSALVLAGNPQRTVRAALLGDPARVLRYLRDRLPPGAAGA